MRKILILAGDVTGNIGDMAIAESTIAELNSQFRGAHITLVADRDKAAKNFPGAHVIPKGVLGLGALIKTALSCDLAICGGGGLFQDDDSRIKMPYWGLRVALARLLGARVVGYCLGVGPLTHGLSRFFGRLAFACMSVVSVRDPIAYEVAKGLTSRPVSIIPDPAIALAPASAEEADKLLQDHGVPSDGSPLIGVAVRKWFHRRGSYIPHQVAFRLGLRRIEGGSSFDRMTTQLAEVLDQLVRRHHAHIVFMPTYNVTHEGDDQVCEEIIKKMHSQRTSLIRISEPSLYKSVAGRLKVLLGGRMHPTIFAAGMGTPVVGLSYNPKFRGFFQLIGCPDKLISIEDFVGKKMTGKLLELIEDSLGASGDGLPATASRLVERYRDFNTAIARMVLQT